MTTQPILVFQLLIVACVLSNRAHAVAPQPEVVIYGATPAGLAAAISLARRAPERQIMLVTPYRRIGGMMTNGLNHPDFRTFEARTGLYRELNRRVESYFRTNHGDDSPQVADSLFGTHASSEVVHTVFRQMIDEQPSISVLTNHRLIGLKQDGPRITSVTVGSITNRTHKPTTLNANYFIDATYEGDLMAAAGVEYRVGREARSEYGESLAPLNADKQLQGYNFRLTMTDRADNRAPVPKPDGYRREEYLPLLHLLSDGTIKRVFGDPYGNLPGGIYKRQTPKLPNGKRDINDVSHSPVRLSLPNLNRDWPEGDADTRKHIFDEHVRHNVGMLYFLQHDQAVPEVIRKDALQWGLCKDEFTDNDHLPEQLYVREARRMVGRYVFTQRDTERTPETSDSRAVFHADAIAMGDYGPNCHGTLHVGPVIGGKHTGEFYQRAAPYQIPYGTLLPKTIDNLAVPVACSASHVGFCALRLEPIWMSLGQAAGEAIELAMESDAPLATVASSAIQARLHGTGTATIYTSDVPEESAEFQAVQWWGSEGGLIAIDRERGQDDIKYGTRGDQRIGQYYEAFPRHSVELDQPLSAELRTAWKKLAMKACGRFDWQLNLPTRREFILSAFKHRLKRNPSLQSASASPQQGLKNQERDLGPTEPDYNLESATNRSIQNRPRLAILTDIGGDPDDQQSMIRLMVYSNEFEIEALIASASGTPGELKKATTRPDLIHEIVDAYEKVLPNLQKHARGWPSAEYLRKRVMSGNPNRGLDFIGEGHDTEGSRELIRLVDAGTTDRPLNLSIWGGQTDLAQALCRVKKKRGPDGLATFVAKLRVYDIADQDGIAEWIHDEFPGLYYILNKAPDGFDKRRATFRGMYLTGDESLTSRDWIDQHIRSKGPLGALYPTKTWTAPNKRSCLKESDTPSWFFFLPLGGNDPKDPSKAGWGGKFQKSKDGWFRDVAIEDEVDPRETVSKFRPKFQADFAKRMCWCVVD